MYLHVLMTVSVCQQPCRHYLWILARGTSQAVVGHCHPDEANMFPRSVAVTRQLWSLAEHVRLKTTTRRYKLDGIGSEHAYHYSHQAAESSRSPSWSTI